MDQFYWLMKKCLEFLFKSESVINEFESRLGFNNFPKILKHILLVKYCKRESIFINCTFIHIDITGVPYHLKYLESLWYTLYASLHVYEIKCAHRNVFQAKQSFQNQYLSKFEWRTQQQNTSTQMFLTLITSI